MHKRTILNNTIIDSRLFNRNIIRLEDYKNARISMLWKCTLCNHIWKSSADNISRGKGCAKCDGQLQVTKEYAIEKLNKNNPLVKLVGDVVNSKKLTLFECILCQHRWETSLSNVYRKKDPSGCPVCINKNEKNIGIYLTECIINYINHYNLKINNRLFIVDFSCLIDNITVFIEYNGEQHYAPYRYDNRFKYIDKFNKQIVRDMVLRQYCTKNNIVLIEIPYYLSKDDIKDVIYNLKKYVNNDKSIKYKQDKEDLRCLNDNTKKWEDYFGEFKP